MALKEQVAESIPLRREPVDVGVLLELTMEVMHLQAKALDVALKVRVADEVPALLHLDGDKVAWAVANLVGTALRHVRRGTQLMPGGSIDVEVNYDSVRGELTITVRDDGSGIPPDRLKNLLNRGTRSHPGAALALQLVHDIAAAHGGGMEIESNADRFEHFTKVRITIPAR
jgi:two-component system OmpR family sensor kinase